VPWRALTHPVNAFLLHAAAICVLHLASLYDATVSSEVMHAAQHASFVATALLFWWVVLRPSPARGGTTAAIGLLFGTVMHTGARRRLWLGRGSRRACGKYVRRRHPRGRVEPRAGRWR